MLITNLITEKMPGSIHTESAINFYKSIDAPLRAISILEDGFKLPFRNKEIPQFWIRNNRSFFKYYDFAKEKLQEWISSVLNMTMFNRGTWTSNRAMIG